VRYDVDKMTSSQEQVLQVFRRPRCRDPDAADCHLRQPVVTQLERLNYFDNMEDNVVVHASQTSEVRYRGNH